MTGCAFAAVLTASGGIFAAVMWFVVWPTCKFVGHQANFVLGLPDNNIVAATLTLGLLVAVTIFPLVFLKNTSEGT